MLGLYTNFNNNTYLNQNYSNQNYGYGQSAMNPYQQQSNFFGGYQAGYQQQPACDMNSMLFSILNSLLPLMLGFLGNKQPAQQQPAANQQLSVASTLPITNNASTVINGNSGQNNIFNTIINIILNSGKTPVSVDEETVDEPTEQKELVHGYTPNYYIKMGYTEEETKKLFELFDVDKNNVLDLVEISAKKKACPGPLSDLAGLAPDLFNYIDSLITPTKKYDSIDNPYAVNIDMINNIKEVVNDIKKDKEVDHYYAIAVMEYNRSGERRGKV